MTKFVRITAAMAACLCAASAARADGYRTTVGEDKVPLVVVKGTPYEMGYAFGKLMPRECQTLINGFLQGAQRAEREAFTKDQTKSRVVHRYTDAALDAAWRSTSPYISKRFQEQMRGLADGARISLATLRRAYMIPVVSNYSCSGAAVWGKATADGHLYQFRNLDYSMDGGLQDFPAIVVMLPDEGVANVSLTFAGFLGVNTGMNAAGTVLSEMGDSPGRDYPFNLDGVPFFVLFSDLLNDAGSLDQALGMIRGARRIKKYHYIVANGQDLAGVKIKAHAPDLIIWTDDDPKDEFAPNVFKDIVYNAESRGPLAVRNIKANYGKYDAARMIDLTRLVPIKGSNLLGVVYDATELRFWFAYAKGPVEAYQRPFTEVNLKDYLTYRPDRPGVVDKVSGVQR